MIKWEKGGRSIKRGVQTPVFMKHSRSRRRAILAECKTRKELWDLNLRRKKNGVQTGGSRRSVSFNVRKFTNR